MSDKKKKPAKKKEQSDEVFTSIRVYVEDHVKLSKLAALMEKTIADAYHEVCNDVIDGKILLLTEDLGQSIRDKMIKPQT